MSCHNKDKCCSLDMGRGCVFCNCETEASASVCEGCFKLHSTDWLEGMPEMFPDDIYEVRFKNTRRSFYRNVNNLPLKKGDIVAVEASPGHDIGIISLTGDMVARQMRRVGFSPLNGEFKKIYRKAKPYDIEKWQEAIAMEHETMIRSRQIAADMGLNMKIGDVEYQGDKIKAIFYYIADERVDFRELIKVFAEQFRIRVEMKQIGARQEAGRIGGIGSCGRELCCASWISSFVSVTTNAARTQEISLNPQKLAGQCSKLKCCLVYELDSYIDARKEFPRINQPLQVLDGDYFLVKSDILARTMSFSTSPHGIAGMITLPLERVREVLEMNRKGRKPEKLEDESAKPLVAEDPGFINMIGEESITRFDKVRDDRGRQRKGRNRKGPAAQNGEKDNKVNNTEGGNREASNNNNRRSGGRVGNNNRREGQEGSRNSNRGENQSRGENQGRTENRSHNATRGENQSRNNGRRDGQDGDKPHNGNRHNSNRNQRPLDKGNNPEGRNRNRSRGNQNNPNKTNNGGEN